MSYLAIAVLIPLVVWLIPFTGSRLLFLAVPAALGYSFFVLQVRHSVLSGFLFLLFWSLILTVSVLYFTHRHRQQMHELIFRSNQYSDTMFLWLRTGQLPEGDSRQVIVTHMKQATLYCLLALLTANLASLVFGTALLNYMNAYVARLSSNSTNPIKVALLGWNPWSIVRVVSFLWLGVVLSLPILSLFIDVPAFRLSLLLPGFLGVLLDITLKVLLSEAWRTRINRHR